VSTIIHKSELILILHLKACVFLKPKRIAVTGGYFGCHEAIAVYGKGRERPVELIDLDDEYQEGDVCWLETPLNPTGESRYLSGYFYESVSQLKDTSGTYSIMQIRHVLPLS